MTRVIATSVNGIKTYHITSESVLPDHYGARANRRIGTHSALKNRVDFIADFEFVGSSRQLCVSNDGLTVAVTGEYPPQIKIFDLVDLSQSTLFSLNGMPCHFQFVSDDWSKLVALRIDRKLDFFNKGGEFFTVPLPMKCRHFSYSKPTADIILASEESQLLRVNLELGQFMKPIPTTYGSANQVVISDVHQLIAAGFESGEIEFFDPRDKRSIVSVSLGNEVTKMAFDQTGFKLATGMSNGSVSIFDIRSSKPLYSYSHRNQSPINSIYFHPSHYVISGDKRGCRIHGSDDGKFFTSFETKYQMNSVVPFQSSGLLFATVESEKIQVMLIPELGPAPRWASFLDNIVTDVDAEKEEGMEMYQDMKFITRDDIEKFEMHHLIKSSVLKPYMHGFFIPRELYRLITDKSSSTEYGDYLKYVRDSKKEDKEKSSIQQIRSLPKKDNGDLEVSEYDSKRKAKKKKQQAQDPYYQ